MDINKIMQLLSDPKSRQLLTALVNQVTGGKGGANLNGLLEQLNSGGLQQQVQSWVGTGQNQQVDGQQVEQALGVETVEQIGQQAGMSEQEAADGLANILPQLVDQASPNGQMENPQATQEALAKLMQPSQPQ